MRSRTFREGSVGLLLLVGVGLFGALALWLNRLTPGQQSYKAFVQFANAGGMQKGASVRFRGVKVGNIAAIRPGPNGVEVEIEIPQPDLIIPRDVIVEANQTGLISESIIDITPRTNLPPQTNVVANALDPKCNPSLIICNGARLQGQIGISLDELIRSTNKATALYSDPKFYNNINEALRNTSVAAASVASLTRDLSGLTKSTQQQLNNFSSAANSVERSANQVSASTQQLTTSANRSLNQLTASTNQTVTKLSNSADAAVNKFGATADEIRLTAREANKLVNSFDTTSTQVNKLVTNLDNLVTSNRGTLVSTLNNLSQTSEQLRVTLTGLSPTLNQVTQGKLLQNLETLSANAAQASVSLRDATQALNEPNNLLLLQQTLDAARVTFENTQKITSDLDELTGDPKLRDNLRQLINGLSGLVSSTNQIEEQVEVAQTLDTLRTAAIAKQKLVISQPDADKKAIFNPSTAAVNKEEDKAGKILNLE